MQTMKIKAGSMGVQRLWEMVKKQALPRNPNEFMEKSDAGE